MGAAAHYFFSEDTFKNWGWRIPYLLGGLFSLFIYYTRLQMQETQVFEHLKHNQLLVRNPMKTVFKKNLPHLLRTVGLTCMGTTFYCFAFIYLPMSFFKEQFSFTQVSGLMMLLLMAMTILVPIAGRICDAVGRRKMLLFNACFVTLIIIPGFYAAQMHNLPILILALILFAIASSLEQGATLVTVVENYPSVARYTGLSLGYNIGNGILGGTIPIVSEYLLAKTHLSFAPAIYVTAWAAVTVLVVLFFVRETKEEQLI
jgi:MHS family proline/betaine transporter-like MFS transporter